MKKLVSIIVPIYNSGKYLDKCLESLINQIYKNIEIILVDDSSIDNSYKICLDYSKKDSRIKVYQKENKGPSSARNYGLNKISGDYLLFVDSDDYLDIEAVEYLIKNDSHDSLVCLYEKEDDKKIIKTKSLIYDNLEFIKLNIKRKLPVRGGCCGYLFKRELLKEIYFNEELYLTEDVLFLVEYVMKIKKVKFLDKKICYHYVKNINSITRSNNYILRKIKSIILVINKLNEVTDNLFLKEFNNKKVIMLEKEVRYIKTTSEIEEILKIIDKIKFYGFNLRYNIFCYLVNHEKVNLLLLYYKLRRILKKVLKKSL